jgi:hypothetical protein
LGLFIRVREDVLDVGVLRGTDVVR